MLIYILYVLIYIYLLIIKLINQLQIVPKKRGWMVRIGSVNNVTRTTSAYSAARQEDAQLQADLTASNNVISELRADKQESRSKLRLMAGMFDLITEQTRRLRGSGEMYVLALSATPLQKIKWSQRDKPSTVVQSFWMILTFRFIFFFGLYVFWILEYF